MMSGSERLPLANRPSTVLGIILPFGVIAAIAVGLRLYTRIRILKSLGWDDAVILLALIIIIAGAVFVCLCVASGLGHHFADLPNEQIMIYLFHFYLANGTYHLSTTFIKLSLLLQYLRVYTNGPMRKVCITFLIIIGIWGLLFSTFAWLPCFPVRAYWDWELVGAKCYGYGAKTEGPFSAVYESHSALNLFFDITVLLCSLPMCLRNDRSKKEQWGIAGLLIFGAWIVTISAWRLATIVAHRAGWYPVLDFTYYAPPSIILSCLEVNFAIIAASCPIFWPVLESGFSAIFVKHEVTVTSYRRNDDDNDLEMECAGLRSPNGSERSLRQKMSTDDYYNEPYVIEHVAPFKGEQSLHVAECLQLDKT